MKKIISVFAFIVLAIAVSVTAFAADSDIIASGYCGGEGDGTNLTWTLTEDGTLTISGEGRMASYDEEDAPWEVYLDKFDKLVIKEGVTIIGSEAFFWCQNLTGNIVIPDSVIDIYSYAFDACNFDGKLTIGKNVKYIGDLAFNSCFYLTGDLIIPKSVETIGDLAFSDCQHLTGDLIIPDSVKSLGYKAFWRCKGFNGDLIIGDNVKTIGFETFRGCSGFTGKLILGNKVEIIEQSAFAGCSGFTGKLIIPKSVKTIEHLAFQSCGIDEYYFAGNAPTVESSSSFDSDDTIYYPSGNSTWIIEDGKWNGYTAIPYDTLPSFEPDATLSISSEKLVSGGQTTLSVTLSENSNAAMAQFAIKYDSSVLELVSASEGELMKDATINSETSGIIYFAWDDPIPVTEAGTILNLTFKTAEGAEPGETLVEIDENEKFVFSKTNLEDLIIDVENGSVIIVDAVYGDLTGDGEVDIRDAYMARLIAAKLHNPTETQLIVGDVDGDGKNTAVDANYIRKYSVKLISVFPVEQQ